MRLSIAAAVSLALISLGVAQQSGAAMKAPTDIPAQPLGQALQTLAKDRDFQIVYVYDDLLNLRTAGVVGRFTADEALKQLLAGTGFTFKYLDAKTVTIVPAARTDSALSQATGEGVPEEGEGSGESARKGDQGEEDVPNKFLWQRFRLAQADQGPSAALSSTPVSSEGIVQLEEVIVTAQKHEERAQDVPVSMTVIDPNVLAENGQSRLVDYFSSVPGLSLSSNSFGAGTQYLSIRGLSVGHAQNSTVATVIDDVPVGSGQVLAFGSSASPDLDPSDLARIEVLKGPQGTLYGADSLGGLIKYVTTDPSTSAYSGRAEVTGIEIPGGGAGYVVRAAGNNPLSDILAMGVSGFARRDPGYIDNLTTGQNNINSADVYGGHLTALFRPSEDFSLKLGALVQNTNGNGTPYVNSSNPGDYPQGDLKTTGMTNSGQYYTRWQLYTAALSAKLAGLDVTSVTGYNTNTIDTGLDATTLDSPVANDYFGVTGATFHYHYHTDKVSQEFRVSSSIQKWFDWTAGAFYSHETSPGSTFQDRANNLTTGEFVGAFFQNNYSPVTFSEYALFGDLTFHLTDRFDVQVGGRHEWEQSLYQNVSTGPAVYQFAGVPSPDVHPAGQSSANPFTYLVTPELSISPDLRVYARVASGFRIGGPNFFTGGGFAVGVPPEYKPDTTVSYELGVKGDIPEIRLSFDAAAYYISWKDVQLNVANASDTGYVTNAGNAKSEGIEWSMETHPVSGFTLSAQGSYNNAVLTQNLPQDAVNAGTYALAGDRLPYNIRLSGGLKANQDIRLPNEWVAFVGGAVNYVGSRPYEFASGPTQPREWLPAYTQLNLRTGARYQSWLLNLYVNNVTDKRGVDGLLNFAFNQGNTGGQYTVVTQPRTVGLGVIKSLYP
jgi:iron complex outermembrane receptor protein